MANAVSANLLQSSTDSLVNAVGQDWSQARDFLGNHPPGRCAMSK